MTITSILSGQSINSVYDQPLNRKNNNAFLSLQKNDSVSISPEARELYEKNKEILNDLGQRLKIVDRNNTTIGLPENADIASGDLLYIPSAIVSALPSYDFSPERMAAHEAVWEKLRNQEIPNSAERALLSNGMTDEKSLEISAMWAEYSKTLNDYGINYQDKQAFTEFLNNFELKNQVEQDFESRI